MANGLNTVIAIATVMVVIGLVLGIGFMVLEEFEETLGTNVTTIYNETIAPTDAGVFVVNNRSTDGIFCYHSFSVVRMFNATNGVTIGSGNYSVQSATGRVQNTTSEYPTGLSVNSWNVTYTYTHDDGSACEGLNESIDAVNEIPTWLSILVIIAIVGVLLYLVFRFKGFAGGGSIAQI